MDALYVRNTLAVSPGISSLRWAFSLFASISSKRSSELDLPGWMIIEKLNQFIYKTHVKRFKCCNTNSNPCITHQLWTVQWLCKQEAQLQQYSHILLNLYQGSQTKHTLERKKKSVKIKPHEVSVNTFKIQLIPLTDLDECTPHDLLLMYSNQQCLPHHHPVQNKWTNNENFFFF